MYRGELKFWKISMLHIQLTYLLDETVCNILLVAWNTIQGNESIFYLFFFFFLFYPYKKPAYVAKSVFHSVWKK